MHNCPLVSVNVLTYNSSKYVLETLESIKAQTYPNIELVISDDKSTDNTISICKKWTEKNKDRFANIQIIIPEKNTGQSGNYNRAFRAATGEWIKEIDGDDMLLPNCIEDCISFVQKDEKIKYVFGDIGFCGKSKNQIERVKSLFDYNFFSLTSEAQINRLINQGNCIPSPSSFYNKQLVLDLNFECDERIPYLEDWPKWISLLKKGVTFYHLNKEIVLYRVDSGISTARKLSYRYFESNMLVKKYYVYPEWLKNGEEFLTSKIVQEECNMYKEILDYDKHLHFYMDLPIIKFLRFLFSWRHKS